jgi:hypothetical protein
MAITRPSTCSISTSTHYPPPHAHPQHKYPPYPPTPYHYYGLGYYPPPPPSAASTAAYTTPTTTASSYSHSEGPSPISTSPEVHTHASPSADLSPPLRVSATPPSPGQVQVAGARSGVSCGRSSRWRRNMLRPLLPLMYPCAGVERHSCWIWPAPPASAYSWDPHDGYDGYTTEPESRHQPGEKRGGHCKD